MSQPVLLGFPALSTEWQSCRCPLRSVWTQTCKHQGQGPGAEDALSRVPVFMGGHWAVD